MAFAKFIFLFLILFQSCQKELALENQEEICLLNSRVFIGNNDWVSYKDVGDQKQNANERTVGQLKIPKKHASCSGFLINQDTLMTNNHCINSAEVAINAKAVFRTEDGERVSYDCSEFILSSVALDFTLVRCKDKPGRRFGWVKLNNESVEVGTKIYLVQENCDYLSDPHCQIDKFVAYGEIKQATSTRVAHDADTLGGSSGSPVFSQEAQVVVALHNAGSLTSNSPANSLVNYAVPMSKIISKIRESSSKIQLYEGREIPTSSTSCL